MRLLVATLLCACSPARIAVDASRDQPWQEPAVDGDAGSGDVAVQNPDEVETVGGWDVPDDGDSDEERLYLEDVVGELHLELTQDEERDLRRDPYEWTTATLVRDELRYTVGVRLKGSSTYSSIEDKPSFKIDVDRLLDQTYLGHEEFNLHNQILDPSRLSEAMSFWAYREAGLPAPRVAYTRLTVNDEDYGLYTIVEPPNREFLALWFGDDQGNLYENGYQDCDVTRPSCFEVEQDDLGGKDDLFALADIAELEGDAWRDAMTAFFDWDNFIGAMAMEAMIAHWDGYAYDLSNYRLFHAANTGLTTFLPWSADLDYGYRPWSYPNCGQYATAPEDYDDGVLARRCEEDPTCHAELVDRMEALLDQWESNAPLSRLDTLHDLIEPAVADDPRASYDSRDFEEHTDCVAAWISQRPEELRAWFADTRGE